MRSVGFVGLGTMGGRLARRLLSVGHEVYGFNRTPERARSLVGEGLHLCGTPRAVVERSEVVFSMVTGNEALRSVAEGPDGILAGLRPGQVWVDMTTAGPEVSRELARRAAERGGCLLDAPVSGSVTTLEQGQLSIMVGGDRAAFERVEPLLHQLGRRVTYVGGNGDALLLKLAINLSLPVQMLAFSEGVLLAERSGIPREVAVRTMLDSVMASPMLGYRGPFVLELPEEAWFDVSMMQKDVLLALETGRKLDVPMPATALANEMLTAARGMGFGRRDFAAIFHTLASMAGGHRLEQGGDQSDGAETGAPASGPG
ncbi:MAG TPA: NAD(P)-dependent oxidoreductase [Candidatus Dormibacteraeota bacterium]|nr:NAD(P)-dependent oxidoreductase [Candidatus Dormibacteraeota bacterium]